MTGDIMPAAASVHARCAADTQALIEALHGATAARRAAALIAALAPAPSLRALGRPPAWSGVCDDCSPYELSIALHEDGVDVRLLVEAQHEPASAHACWSAGLALNARLQAAGIADLALFRQLQPQFEPDPAAPPPWFAVYHAIEWRAEGTVRAKVYLNPAVGGTDTAIASLDHAAQLAGVSDGWAALAGGLTPAARPVLVSIDLAARSRFKVYVRIWDASCDAVAALYARANAGGRDDALAFLDLLTAGARSLSARPLLAVHHLAAGSAAPSRLALDLPVLPYCEDDGEAQARIRALLARFGQPEAPYLAALAALSSRAVTARAGRHSYVSLQPGARRPRITVYFNPLLYVDRTGFAALDPAPDFWSMGNT
jgi:DMATS type aromatic prenyltransferase